MAIFLLILKAILMAIISNLPAIIAASAGTILLQSQNPSLCKSMVGSTFGINAVLWIGVGAVIAMVIQKLHPSGSSTVPFLSRIKHGIAWVKAQWAAIP